jgi:phosphoglycerol transferase
MGGVNFDITIPNVYRGDGLYYSWVIKGITEGVSWYGSYTATGYPYVSSLLDFPGISFGNYLVVKLLSLFSDNYAVVLNLFYISGFPLAALSAFFVFRRFSLSYPLSMVGAILFAFLPYHFMRSHHL